MCRLTKVGLSVIIGVYDVLHDLDSGRFWTLD